MADGARESTQPAEPGARGGGTRARTKRRERVAPGERARFEPIERPAAGRVPDAGMERTTAQKAAIGAGALSCAIGALGFFAPAVTGNRDRLINTHTGKLFGVFATNTPHALAHLGLGVWGLAAGRSSESAKRYLRASAAVYAGLATAGWIRGRDRKGIFEFLGIALNRPENVLNTASAGASALLAARGREREIGWTEPEAGRRRAA